MRSFLAHRQVKAQQMTLSLVNPIKQEASEETMMMPTMIYMKKPKISS